MSAIGKLSWQAPAKNWQAAEPVRQNAHDMDTPHYSPRHADPSKSPAIRVPARVCTSVFFVAHRALENGRSTVNSGKGNSAR
jgi:hypothetical protein